MKTFLRTHAPKSVWNTLKATKKSAKKLLLRAAKYERRKGVLFIGYVEGDLGLGQVIRNDILAAIHAGLPFAVYPFTIGIETRLIGGFMPERYDKGHSYDVNIIVVAPDQTPAVFSSLDPRLSYDTYNILRTYWELPKAPIAWRQMLEDIDEIWAPSKFVADAFRPIFPGPITVMPTTVEVGDGPWKGREDFGLEQERFYFLFSFDYFSSPYRKNPIAVLEAFERAFPDKTENVGLVIKSIGNAGDYPDIQKTLFEATAVDPRIRIIHGSFPYNDMAGLILAADVYISLHRSEGFGLGMAEAMYLERIVIGTDFSGNNDFLTEETGFPIPYTLRPVTPREYPRNTEAQAWAEPNLNEAARILRQVFEAPGLAVNRARAGRVLVRNKYGLGQVGRAMKQRLSALGLLDR